MDNLKVLLHNDGPMAARIYLQVAKEGIGPNIYHVKQFPQYIYPSCLLIKENMELVETELLLSNTEYVKMVGKMFAKVHQQPIEKFHSEIQVLNYSFIQYKLIFCYKDAEVSPYETRSPC